MCREQGGGELMAAKLEGSQRSAVCNFRIGSGAFCWGAPGDAISDAFAVWG